MSRYQTIFFKKEVGKLYFFALDVYFEGVYKNEAQFGMNYLETQFGVASTYDHHIGNAETSIDFVLEMKSKYPLRLPFKRIMLKIDLSRELNYFSSLHEREIYNYQFRLGIRAGLFEKGVALLLTDNSEDFLNGANILNLIYIVYFENEFYKTANTFIQNQIFDEMEITWSYEFIDFFQ